jgi:hypothetical protein
LLTVNFDVYEATFMSAAMAGFEYKVRSATWHQ